MITDDIIDVKNKISDAYDILNDVENGDSYKKFENDIEIVLLDINDVYNKLNKLNHDIKEFEKTLPPEEFIFEDEYGEKHIVKNKSHIKFIKDMERNNFEIIWYHGRFSYEGPAVESDSHNGVYEDDIRSATTVSLQQDNMGYDYIFYPR